MQKIKVLQMTKWGWLQPDKQNKGYRKPEIYTKKSLMFKPESTFKQHKHLFSQN
jgi:hypothetical protein